jgi:hypothetical protein
MSKTSSKNKYENLMQWLKVRKNSIKPIITIYKK